MKNDSHTHTRWRKTKTIDAILTELAFTPNLRVVDIHRMTKPHLPNLKWDRSTASKRVSQLVQSQFIRVTKQEIVSGHLERWYALQLRGLLWIMRENSRVQYHLEEVLKLNLETLGIPELEMSVQFLDFMAQITRERRKFYRLCISPLVTNELFQSLDFQRSSDEFLTTTFIEMLYEMTHS
jgi:hypothetical protein